MGNGLVADFILPANFNTLNKSFCPHGHEVLPIQGGVQVMDMGIIFGVQNYGFCPTCRGIYTMTGEEDIKPGQTKITAKMITNDGKVLFSSYIVTNNEFLSSESLGFIREMERESKK